MMNSTLIYKNDMGYELHMVILVDNSKKKQSIGYFVVSPDGKMSEIEKISRSKIITSKNWCNFVYDLLGDFNREDVERIRNEVSMKLQELKKVEDSRAIGIDEAHHMICKYVEQNNIEDFVFVDDEGYCNIDTRRFDSILKELETGYTKLQILRALKVKEALKISKGRPFDYRLYDKDKNPYWAYRIKNVLYKEKNDVN